MHLGAAESDVLCCRRPGEHADSQNHSEAVSLLQRVDIRRARDLEMLLGIAWHEDPLRLQRDLVE